MQPGSWDNNADLVQLQDSLPDSTIKLWGYLDSPPAYQDGNAYLRLQVRPTATARPLPVVLVTISQDLDRKDARLLKPGMVVVAEGHHLGTARPATGSQRYVCFSGRAGSALQVLQPDAVAGSPLEGLAPEVHLAGTLVPDSSVFHEGDVVEFKVRPYAATPGVLPPDTPVRYQGERAQHIYDCITTRPHIDVIGSARACDGERYPWSIDASSVVTGELLDLGRA